MCLIQLSIFAIAFPPVTPGNCSKGFLPLWGFCIIAFCMVAGICWGSSRGAGICPQTIFATFGIFIFKAKSRWLTILWDLFIALQFKTFLKKIVQSLEVLSIACLTFCLLLTDRSTLGLPEKKLKVVNICKMHGRGGLEVVVLCRNCKKKW